ncbi:ABC transporter family substrate-binding protein [Haloglycomyces albus]|uniref:ABC transporter family substrate-binding protein n=1 Tax=Haloglycomyces albus TaxID=526067 RepID=UPI00046CB851|nr:ABC transporter family substrate-binding protein [Haloglycomyces albus]
MTKKVKLWASLSATVVASVLLASCGSGDGAEDSGFEACLDRPTECNSGDRADGGSIVWGLEAGWNGWHSTSSEFNSIYTNAALAGMTPKIGEFDQNGDWYHNDGILDGEPYEISSDPLTVGYPLNPAANWGDGTSITADDFVFSWYAYSGDEDKCGGCSPTRRWGANVADVKADGDNVVVTYKKDYYSAEWKYEEAVLTLPAHRAPEDWKSNPEALGNFIDDFATERPDWSAGPYRIKDGELGEWVTYEPNPDWPGSVKPTLDEIEMRVFESPSDIVAALGEGEIDGAAPSQVTSDDLAALHGKEGIDYDVAPGSSWELVSFNMEHDLLEDDALRKAIFYALDTNMIVDRTAGTVLPGAVAKGNHIFRNDSDFFVDHVLASGQGSGDVERATQELEASGYYWEDSALYTPDGKAVELSFSYNVGNDVRADIAELVQELLSDIGIDITIDAYTESIGEKLSSGDYEIVNHGWSSSATFVQSAGDYWYSDSALNFGHLESDEIDAVIDEIRQTEDLDKAAELSNEAVELATDEAYVLPIFDAPDAIMVNEDLVNVRDNWASSLRALYNMAEWGISDE